MKKIFLLLCLAYFGFLNVQAGDTDKQLSSDKYYETVPNVANCKAGIITQAEKDKVIAEINAIRAVHHLKPVVYNDAFDADASEAALIMAANETLDHQPPTSYKCWSASGYNGAEHTNLFISWHGANSDLRTEESIENWMSDYPSNVVGHRRWIIDPFLRHVALGRADGPSTKNAGYSTTGMALYCIDRDNEQVVTDWPYDFVAYPFEYYKPKYVYCDTETGYPYHYLSFTYIADKTQGYLGNVNVSYANTTVSMTDEDGNKITIAQTLHDNDGYGTANCFKWLPTELEQDKKYLVEIKNVQYKGSTKNFSYWFMVTDEAYQAAPGIPTLESPINLSTNIIVKPTLSWSASSGTKNYRLQVSKDANMSSFAIDKDDIKTNYYNLAAGLDYNTTYYWRVSAGNDVGMSDYSTIRSFTTKKNTPTDKVVLLEPSNNKTISSLLPKMKWESFEGAKSFTIKIAPDENVETYSGWYGVNKTVNTISYQVEEGDLELDTQYWWVVRATLADGQTEWSEKWTFTVSSGGDLTVQLLEPINAADKITLTPTLKWNTIDGINSYELQLADNKSMAASNIVWSKQNLTTTEITVPENFLKPSREYSWRVRAIKSGAAAPWSEIWQFYTNKDVNTVPSAYFPLDSAVKVALDVKFEWTPIPDAASYNLKVYNKNVTSPSTTIIDQSNLTTTSFKTDGSVLQKNRIYWWQIQAVSENVSATWPWSYVYVFTTADQFPSEGIFDMNTTQIDVSIYPTPAAEKVNFMLNLPAADDINLIVFDNNGKIINTIKNGYLGQGNHLLNFDANTLSSGTYYYYLTASDGKTWGKFIIQK